MVDDGSTDHSLEVCRKLSQADGRIKVHHQENKGVSAARNYGLDLAEGEYIFFLDSDDAIHPLLFEEMIRQMEGHHAEMAFCKMIQLDDRQLDSVLEKASPQDRRPQWQIGDGEEAERWFHIDHMMALRGVSGMIVRELIGTLRFDVTMSYGEDSMFKYELFRRQVRTVYSAEQWYYYRVNPSGLSHCLKSIWTDAYFVKTIRIRDSEYQSGNIRYALVWETVYSCKLRQKYKMCRELGRKELCRQVKDLALQECKQPLFQSIDIMHKGLFYLCSKCYPLYVPISYAADLVWRLKERGGKNR